MVPIHLCNIVVLVLKNLPNEGTIRFFIIDNDRSVQALLSQASGGQ